MTPHPMLEIIIGIIGSIFGAIIANFLFKKYGRKPSFTPTNAEELLRLGRPEEWNEIRILYPQWIPDLREKNFDGLQLPEINLERVNLLKSSFRRAILDGAVFVQAQLAHADFSDASLVGVNFEGANLNHAVLQKANLERANLEFADLSESRLDEANLNGASIRNAKLDLNKLSTTSTATLASSNEIDYEVLLGKAQENPDLLQELSPIQFEKLIAKAFEMMNYKVVQADRTEGFDFVLTKNDPIAGPLKFLVEAKRTRTSFKVGRSSIRALYAALLNTAADRAILITTTELTPLARDFVQQLPQMIIIDRNNLPNWIRKIFNKTDSISGNS